MHSYQVGYTTALRVCTAHSMTWSFWRNHPHVQIGAGRYFGGYSPGNGLSLVPAQLAVAQHGPAGGLVVQLLDASGAALTAPVRLQPAAGAVPGAATGCP